MQHWYVIQTKPGKELEAGSYLSIKGVEIFSPLIETFSLARGRVLKQEKPLFLCYVFAKFDLEVSYPLVRWARGVKKILSFGGYPTPVSEEVVSLIKMRTDTDGVVRRRSELAPYDKVRFKSGPLRDLLGIFERWVSDSERVRILLSLIGYQPTIEVHHSMVERVA